MSDTEDEAEYDDDWDYRICSYPCEYCGESDDYDWDDEEDE